MRKKRRQRGNGNNNSILPYTFNSIKLTTLEKAEIIRRSYENKFEDGEKGPRTSGKIERDLRREVSLELRLYGYSYPEIAILLGISTPTAFRDVRDALEDMQRENKEEKEKLTNIEVARIDKMIKAIYRKATEGILIYDDKEQPIKDKNGEYIRIIDKSAIDRVLKLQERKAKFLGLDAPERRQIGNDPENPFTLPQITVEKRTLNILQRFLPDK